MIFLKDHYILFNLFKSYVFIAFLSLNAMTVNGQSKIFFLNNINTDTALFNKQIHVLNSLINFNDGKAYLLKNISTDTLKNINYGIYTPNYFYKNISLDSIAYSYGDYNFKKNLQALIYKTNWKNISLTDFSKILTSILLLTENSGYPFTQIKKEVLNISNDSIDLRLTIDLQKRVLIDSIIVTNVLSKNYMYNILKIKPGDFYNKKAIDNAELSLTKIGFIKSISKPEVIFTTKQKAILKLNLQAQKVNELEAIIGFLPNNNLTANNGNAFIVTGLANIKLVNQLKRTEQIVFKWKRLQQGTQELQINTELPYIYKFPIGVDANIFLFRRDSTFSNTLFGFALAYRFSFTSFIKFTIQQRQNNGASASNLSNNNENYPNIKNRLIGFDSETNTSNNIFNPIRGYFIKAKVLTSNRSINNFKNNKGIEIETQIKYYKRLYKKWVVMIQGSYCQIANDSIFEHELFRLGGVKTLRGFNDDALYASKIIRTGLEFRYILGKNSNFFVLYDYGYLENKSTISYKLNNQKIKIANLHATGLGINLETKAGVLSLIYAVGTENFPKFDLRYSKIHAGFSAFF